MDSKILDKIQKLLMLGTSPVEAEANAAMKKAGELLARHGLSMSDIEANNKNNADDDGIRKDYINLHNKNMWYWESKLCMGLSNIFDCKIIKLPGYGKENDRIVYIGHKEDLELVSWYHKKLRLLIARQGKMKFKKVADQKEYGKGMVISINTRLQKTFKKVQEEYKGGTELIVLKNKLVAKAVEKEFPNLSKGKASVNNTGSKDAFFKGMVDGEKVSLHKEIKE